MKLMVSDWLTDISHQSPTKIICHTPRLVRPVSMNDENLEISRATTGLVVVRCARMVCVCILFLFFVSVNIMQPDTFVRVYIRYICFIILCKRLD